MNDCFQRCGFIQLFMCKGWHGWHQITAPVKKTEDQLVRSENLILSTTGNNTQQNTAYRFMMWFIGLRWQIMAKIRFVLMPTGSMAAKI